MTGGWRQNRGGITATEVIHYTPATTVPDTGREGYCWTASIAAPRPGAWRCMEGNAIHDPCFSVASGAAAVCGADPPTNNQGFRMTLTRPLPPPETPPVSPQNNGAWLVQLQDGTLCTPFTGTRALIAGEIAVYGCAAQKRGEQTVLLGDLDDSKPIWTARKAVVLKAASGWRLKARRTVRVKAVWQ